VRKSAERLREAAEPRAQLLYLRTAVFTVDAPLAQVLTVVTEEPIAVLPEPRACPAYDLCAVQMSGPWRPQPDRVPAGKARERDLLHRPAPPRLSKGGIVHNGARADIDAVMRISETRRNEMCAERRLFIGPEESIASE